MSFPYYIAKRYLFTRSSNNAINVISAIAVFGIIITTAALFIVLSGFAGLKNFTLEFSSFVDPDLKVLPAEGKSFVLTEEQKRQIDNLDNIASYSKIIQERVVINYGDKSEIITLKGVDESYPKSTIDSILVQGSWFAHNSNQIVSGWGVSNSLAFGILQFEEVVKLYVPRPGKGQISSAKGAYHSINAINTGIFQINEELDNSFAFTGFETAKLLVNFQNNQISALELRLKDLNATDKTSSALTSIFDDSIIIKNRFQLNDALYKMLNTENLVVYLIFLLVLIIALFNVIGSIIMMILDKKKNLKTIYNLGGTITEIRKIFFIQGSLMVLIGGITGLILGFILVFLQKLFGLVPITPSLAYPVAIKPINFVIVLLTISILGIFVSKIAAARISKEQIAAA